MKKELQKKLSFVLFVMAAFFAGVALTVFSSSVSVICIAGALLFATSVYYVMQKETKSPSTTEKTTEILLVDRMAELMRGNEKAEKGVYIAVKKQHEAMEEGLASLEEKLSELIKSQDNALKTLVLYNKENAKQIALSEREELERLRNDLACLQPGETGLKDAMSQVAEAVREMSRRLYEELHENSEAILSELEATVDNLEEMKDIVKGMEDGPALQFVSPVSRETENDFTQGDLLTEVHEDFLPEEELLPAEEEVVEEESFVPEEAPVIQEESVTEVPETKNPEDALASSGVDLSDPNKTLSPDDIAALIAALGN